MAIAAMAKSFLIVVSPGIGIVITRNRNFGAFGANPFEPPSTRASRRDTLGKYLMGAVASWLPTGFVTSAPHVAGPANASWPVLSQAARSCRCGSSTVGASPAWQSCGSEVDQRHDGVAVPAKIANAKRIVARFEGAGVARRAAHPNGDRLFFEFMLTDAQDILRARDFFVPTRETKALRSGDGSRVDVEAILRLTAAALVIPCASSSADRT
jgi:hypothetical protein